jgi:hypothetical protein
MIKLWDCAPVPEPTMRRAQDFVEHAFREAGLALRWRVCPPGVDVSCSGLEGSGEIGLRIFRPAREERARAGHFTGGAAHNVASDRGLAYVYYTRVEEVAADGRLPLHLVLGVVLAHELGHVLLPPGHGPPGLMQPHFFARDWHAASRGALAFTPAEGALMRHRLDGARGTAAALDPHPEP